MIMCSVDNEIDNVQIMKIHLCMKSKVSKRSARDVAENISMEYTAISQETHYEF